MRNALDHILEHLDCCDNEDNDRLQAALAELRRLRAIEAGHAKAVEAAWYEGRATCGYKTSTWEESTSKRALERSGS